MSMLFEYNHQTYMHANYCLIMLEYRCMRCTTPRGGLKTHCDIAPIF